VCLPLGSLTRQGLCRDKQTKLKRFLQQKPRKAVALLTFCHNLTLADEAWPLILLEAFEGSQFESFQ
jgi:hypothetical protein